ncbi:MAG: A24 family peptidase [Acidobacteriota bacterium]
MSAQVGIALLVGLAAVIDDLRRRQISNWICVAALTGGLGWQVGEYGWLGLGYGLGGAVAGFGVFLIFYLLGGMGGGDVKLMAGFGALLGTGKVLEAALWTAGVGGLIAVAVLAVRGLRGLIASQGRAVNQAAVEHRSPQQKQRDESIPYAPAIALGVWLALVPRV